jgi:hypothetical protein
MSWSHILRCLAIDHGLASREMFAQVVEYKARCKITDRITAEVPLTIVGSVIPADKALTNFDTANHGGLVPAFFEAWLPQHSTSGHITRRLDESLTFLEIISLDCCLQIPARRTRLACSKTARAHYQRYRSAEATPDSGTIAKLSGALEPCDENSSMKCS